MTLQYEKDRDEISVLAGGGPELRDDILELVKREIAAEREACAKIADEWAARAYDNDGDQADFIQCAAAIRARGQT